MSNWVCLVLRSSYYYSQIIGFTNFEFDWRTGRVFTTTWISLYAITINAFMVILFGFMSTGNSALNIVFKTANNLFKYVLIFVTLLRISAGLVALLNRWLHKSQLMILTRHAYRLIMARPQVLRMSSLRILVKFINGALIDYCQLVIAFEVNRQTGAFSAYCLELGLQLWVSAILNLAIAQYFLITLLVRAHYHLINSELRQVVQESRDLSCNPTRKGAFMTRCCSLADQLEDLAKQQSQLQSIMTQLDEVFGVQALMVYSGYYVSAVVSAYSVYCLIAYQSVRQEMSLRGIILFCSWCIIYYMDAILNLFMVLHVQDDHKEMIRLLEERTLFASGLDARLEECFESFQLQLIRNPFEIHVLKLFPVDRNSTWAMFGSVILHLIVLIQYDMQNS